MAPLFSVKCPRRKLQHTEDFTESSCNGCATIVSVTDFSEINGQQAGANCEKFMITVDYTECAHRKQPSEIAFETARTEDLLSTSVDVQQADKAFLFDFNGINELMKSADKKKVAGAGGTGRVVSVRSARKRACKPALPPEIIGYLEKTRAGRARLLDSLQFLL